jgi:hypothetical protein
MRINQAEKITLESEVENEITTAFETALNDPFSDDIL